MPKYRQLHVKILDSEDVNDMPDDFTRLTWVLLPLIVDSEGRGLDNAAWVRAKMYPLREDVELPHINAALDCFAKYGMILRYTADNRKYFQVVNWNKYQSGTEREVKSSIPAPDLLASDSGATQELVGSDSRPTQELVTSDSGVTPDLVLTNTTNAIQPINNAMQCNATGDAIAPRHETPQKQGDIVDGMLAYARPTDNIPDYPEDCRAVLEKFVTYWPADVPGKGQKGFSQWITELRNLRAACAEFGLTAIEYVNTDWQRSHFTVSHPQALVKTVAAKVAELRLNAPPKRVEHTQEEIDAIKAKLRGEA